jgi:hypothetical protein
LALDLEEGRLAQIERVVVPEIRLGDAPAALEGRGQRRELLSRH